MNEVRSMSGIFDSGYIKLSGLDETILNTGLNTDTENITAQETGG